MIKSADSIKAVLGEYKAKILELDKKFQDALDIADPKHKFAVSQIHHITLHNLKTGKATGIQAIDGYRGILCEFAEGLRMHAAIIPADKAGNTPCMDYIVLEDSVL